MTTAGAEVWPVLIWNAHGEGTKLLGVYASREAAFQAVKGEPNMTAYVDGQGDLRGRPVREPSFNEQMTRYTPVRWAHGYPVKVQAGIVGEGVPSGVAGCRSARAWGTR